MDEILNIIYFVLALFEIFAKFNIWWNIQNLWFFCILSFGFLNPVKRSDFDVVDVEDITFVEVLIVLGIFFIGLMDLIELIYIYS